MMPGCIRAVRVLLLLVAASLPLFVISCEEAKPGNPLLPAGFREAQVPDVSIKAYAYLRPETPLLVATARFLEGREPVPGLPAEVGIVSSSVWVGPWPTEVGGAARFTDAAALDAVVEQLSKEGGEVEYMRLGDLLYLFHKEGEWVEALKGSIGEGRFVAVEEAYPDEWTLIGMLPEAPPGKALGAGFVKPDEEFLRGVQEEFPELGGELRQLVETARIRSAVFALYSEQPPTTLAELDEEFLTRMDLSALVIAKAGYPGFIINFLFGRAVSGAGLEKVESQVGDAYYKPVQEELHLFLKNRGSIFFVALAPQKEDAQRLLESAFKE